MPTNEKTSPGPWTTSAPLSRFVIDKDRDCVCECRTLADARLIAAAPGMLELLRRLRSLHTRKDEVQPAEWDAPFSDLTALLKRIDGDQP